MQTLGQFPRLCIARQLREYYVRVELLKCVRTYRFVFKGDVGIKNRIKQNMKRSLNDHQVGSVTSVLGIINY